MTLPDPSQRAIEALDDQFLERLVNEALSQAYDEGRTFSGSDALAFLKRLRSLDLLRSHPAAPQQGEGDPLQDTQADGVVFCGKCGHVR